jgi:hypothetical protein
MPPLALIRLSENLLTTGALLFFAITVRLKTPDLKFELTGPTARLRRVGRMLFARIGREGP